MYTVLIVSLRRDFSIFYFVIKSYNNYVFIFFFLPLVTKLKQFFFFPLGNQNGNPVSFSGTFHGKENLET